MNKSQKYEQTFSRIKVLLSSENDWVAAMATVASELHSSFSHFHWTGFYRLVKPDLLKIGPYQGSHGCLSIPLDRGVCGAAARERRTQLVSDVESFPDHIACSATTRSEIVVPIIGKDKKLLGVLDIDSNDDAAFNSADKLGLETICGYLGQNYS
tara:strand:- start:513 stop:977 length:465 start_codon:yes stop_codon:yes gene_type:complete